MRAHLACAALLTLSGCSGDERDLGEIPYEFLRDYEFFEGTLRDQNPADGVLPYSVVATLFADHAGKGRYIVLPEGETVPFTTDELWDFPAGTTLIKSFFFDLDRRDPGGEARIIETRLLIKKAGDGWDGYTYVWDEDESQAVFKKAGDRVDVDFVDEDGMATTQEYIVPNVDECASCHARDDIQQTLGVVPHQLNFDTELPDGSTGNQLEWLADQGVFSGALPPVADIPAFVDPYGSADLDTRARSYLHANCGHCHRPGGGASQAGLEFTFFDPNPPTGKLGICKDPAAAGPGTGGREFDIVPGSPDESIVVFRMQATDPEIKMPELPTRLSDGDGVVLISEWIAAMEPAGCGGP